MGKFSERETVFYRELYRSSDFDIDGFSLLRNRLKGLLTEEHFAEEHFASPYVAIRKTGFDYILELDMPRTFIAWDDVSSIQVTTSAFSFFLTSGAKVKLNFSALDYASVQALKNAFSERGLLGNT